MRWRHCFSSEPEDHDKKAVTALAYSQTLPGLPGGDGHAGWLVGAALLLLLLLLLGHAGQGR
jgi:hypothetical protein